MLVLGAGRLRWRLVLDIEVLVIHIWVTLTVVLVPLLLFGQSLSHGWRLLVVGRTRPLLGGHERHDLVHFFIIFHLLPRAPRSLTIFNHGLDIDLDLLR